MSFQFLSFTKLKNNFSELKSLLPATENEEKIKIVETLLDKLIISNANDLEKSQALTGAILYADFILPKAAPSNPTVSTWRIVDLDTEAKPRQVSTPITDVNSTLGINKDNVLDEASRRQALTFCVEYMKKTIEELKLENQQKRKAFMQSSKFSMFNKTSTGVSDEAAVTQTYRKAPTSP